MPKRIRLHPYLTESQLHERYRQTHDPVERSRWQFLWLLARGLTATAVARVTGYSAYWIGQIARRYNMAGPDAIHDRRRFGRAHQPRLTEEQQAALRQALAEVHPAGDHWCGRTVAAWMSAQLGRRVSRQAAWRAFPQAATTPCPGRFQSTSGLQGTSSPAPTRSRHGVSRRTSGAVGVRRTSYWLETHSAQDLVFRRPTPPGSGPTPL
jgi:transposase